jgi:ABC transporter substrate binding protein
LPELATEPVRLQVDVIVAALFALRAGGEARATKTIPIVMAGVADPIGAGLVQSLASPGGNITGFSNMGAETAAKNVESFRDMSPSLRRVAVLANPVDPFTKSFLEHVDLAGRPPASRSRLLQWTSSSPFVRTLEPPTYRGVVTRANGLTSMLQWCSRCVPRATSPLPNRLSAVTPLRAWWSPPLGTTISPTTHSAGAAQSDCAGGSDAASPP